jgi:hypothetical protein
MIWDIAPINIYVIVYNADGQNLLDSITPNNFVVMNITAEWMGETYTADSLSLLDREAMTREYPGEMHGLMYVTKDGKPMLYFGELNGHATYDDEPLTLYWPDGSTDIIRVKAWADEGYRDLKVYRRFTYNLLNVTKDTSNPIIKIIKE